MNTQINDIMAGTVSLVLLGLGVYLISDAYNLGLRGQLTENSARIMGWLFVAYGLFRGWLVYRRIRNRQD
ncbi:MAG: hypothetical protein LH606_12775 [Cytophagaceae bacterium]|nr:hypothetical protein [Cytophagaceae bacterium]